MDIGEKIGGIFLKDDGLYSLIGKTSHYQISWSLEAVRLDIMIIATLWNLTGTLAALFSGACLILERFEKYKCESRDFETSRELSVRRPPA